MKRRNIALICLALLIAMAFSFNVLAYSINTYGYANPDIDYQNSGVSSIYLTAMSNAQNAWNNASCDCTVSSSSGSYNPLVTFTADPPIIVGFYQSLATDTSDPQHLTTWFRIGMNSELFPSYTANQRQSVCVHELGHAMGLSDLGSGTAIMNQYRDKSTIYTPQSDDINGVNSNW
ncbi:MAG: matrixin family metalloprotease [Syntrophomonas sp.]